MAEMKKINPGYNKVIIKAGTYPKQDKDVTVIGYRRTSSPRATCPRTRSTG